MKTWKFIEEELFGLKWAWRGGLAETAPWPVRPRGRRGLAVRALIEG